MISARAAAATRNFRRMKDTINAIVDEYGLGRVRYAVIVFGDVPAVKVRFEDEFTSADKFKAFLDALPTPSGGAALAKALIEARKAFERAPRPNAKRVVVVITDSKSNSNLGEVRNASKALDVAEVKVIPVAFGADSDKQELEESSQDGKDNLIESKEPFDAKALAKAIVEKSLEGKTIT